jgi:hypothetical protein
MKVDVYKDRILLFPESDAEVHQLEWIKDRVEKESEFAFCEHRQWDIVSLTLYPERRI